MKSNVLKHKHDSEILTDSSVGFSNKLQWAEFQLKARIVDRLLLLLTVATFFALAVVGFMVWQGKDISTAAVGALITGTVGCLGKLLYNATRRYLEQKK